ncbi:MAG: hypothetical protein ACREFU_05435 [Acetobacteraceae bacterium]
MRVGTSPGTALERMLGGRRLRQRRLEWLPSPARDRARNCDNPSRKRLHPFDPDAYRARNIIEGMVCCLNDWRRIATRYDKLAINYASAVVVAIVA